MSDGEASPNKLDLERDEYGLATPESALKQLHQILPTFLESHVNKAGADGLVVPLDGALESSIAAGMAVEALNPDQVTGIIMPAQMTDEAPARDAEALASVLGIEYHRLQLQPLLTAFQRIIGTVGEPTDDLVAVANANERFRMACSYYLSNMTNSLVVGSANRTELLLGSVAKHGENGADLSLLGDLYRTEVKALAKDIGLPEEIQASRQRQTGLAGPNDADELGIETKTLDSLLYRLFDEGQCESTVADQLDIDLEVVQRVKTWYASTQHKRQPPPKPSTDL